MRQTELAARMEKEEETLRGAFWAYRLDRVILGTLEPLLAERLGPKFSAYAQGLRDYARERTWAAYGVGKALGEAAASGRLPAEQIEDLALEDLVGNMPASEDLSALREALLDMAFGGAEVFFSLYDAAALEARSVQEIRAGLWGLRDGGADEAWVEAMSCYLPDEWETPQWM